MVHGEIDKPIKIDTPITNDNVLIKLKMKTHQNGKNSTTLITPISYDENKNQTLIQAIPLTGRQHQIRVHLDSIGHSIVGDTLYGVDEKFANDFLNLITLDNHVNLLFFHLRSGIGMTLSINGDSSATPLKPSSTNQSIIALGNTFLISGKIVNV